MSQDAILAGVDTTGTTAAFLLLDLARNPDQQEELWREVRQWRPHRSFFSCNDKFVYSVLSTVLVYFFL